MENSLPLLIVVTGRPGAGKTTLAHRLAREIRCPLISRDEIKEGVMRTGAWDALPPADRALHVSRTFIETIGFLAERSVSVVAEAAFQHRLWSEWLTPLRDKAWVRIVVCDVTPEVALMRRITRHQEDPQRERLHPDDTVQAILAGKTDPSDAFAGYMPPHLPVPTLVVDTSAAEYHPDLTAIAAWACE